MDRRNDGTGYGVRSMPRVNGPRLDLHAPSIPRGASGGHEDLPGGANRDTVGVMTGRDSEIRIGVSSCLLGAEVRYDGAHKRDVFVMDTLRPFVTFVAVCPEVEIGL